MPSLDDINSRNVASGVPTSSDIVPFYDVSELGNNPIKRATVADLVSSGVTAEATLDALEAMTDAQQADARIALGAEHRLPHASSEIPQFLEINGPYPTYDSAHICVIEVPEGFCGYRYIMAFTPSYGGVEGDTRLYENPCVAVSNDKITWDAPPGASMPLATNAEAVALGLDNWSDAECVFDGTNLIVFWRGHKTGQAKDCIYYRSTTDFVTWTAKASVIVDQPYTSLMAFSVQQEADDTWTMWACDLDGGSSVTRRTSSSPTSGWSAAADCNLPARMSPWHASVKRHNSEYYMLMVSGATSHDGKYRNSMLYSKDGITWEGSHKLFMPVSGQTWDGGGNYRGSFLPKSGFPPKFDVWGIAISTDTLRWRAFYCEKTFDADATLLTTPLTSGAREINYSDWFMHGAGGTGDNNVVGFGWITNNQVADGTVSQSSDPNSYGIGGIIISTLAGGPGRSTAIIHAKASTGTARRTFTKAIRPVWTWWFKPNTSAAGDGFYLGWGQSTGFTGTPNLFVGLRAIKGTDTNFKFLLANNGVIDAATTDLGVALDTNWHRFQMSWNPVTSSWLARVDQNGWTTIANTGTLSSVPVSDAIPESQTGYLNINVKSGTTASAQMRVQSFHWDGTINHY